MHTGRTLLAYSYQIGSDGACFAVLRDRDFLREMSIIRQYATFCACIMRQADAGMRGIGARSIVWFDGDGKLVWGALNFAIHREQV